MAESSIDLQALVGEVNEAIEAGNKKKVLASLIEAHTGVKVTQGQAQGILDAVSAYILINSWLNGSTKLGLLGNFSLVDVAEKTGKIKTQGVEKAWTTPAHSTIKFKANDFAKDIASVNEDNFDKDVVEYLVKDIFESDETEASDDE